MTDNPRPEFWSLIRRAHDASNDTDSFDLYSEDPVSRAQFEKLQAQQARIAIALIDFVVANEVTLKMSLQAA